MTRPRGRRATRAQQRVLAIMATTHVLIHFSEGDERDDFGPAWILWIGPKRTRVEDAMVESLRDNGWVEEQRRGQYLSLAITEPGRRAAQGKE